MNDDTNSCPGTNRNGEPCGHPSGWGTDHSEGPCKFHGGAADNRGSKNGNYSHGAYSEFEDFMFDSLTNREREAVESLDLDEHAGQFAKDVVKEAFSKYLRTGDDRFLREARQWASEFGVIEAAPDKLEVDTDLSVTSEEKEQLDELFDREPQS